MAARYTVEEIKNIIAPIAERHGVAKVSIFGSYARGTASEDSDVDLLIDKGRLRSIYDLSGFRLDCEDALDIPVDLVTSASENRRFLDRIGKEAMMIYVGT